jgi:four helix bundle protein
MVSFRLSVFPLFRGHFSLANFSFSACQLFSFFESSRSPWSCGPVVDFSFSAFQYFLPIMRLTEELRQRTKRFASQTIRFYVKLPLGREEVKVLGKQLLRSGTSVAAHAREAARARSDSEFCSKLDGLLQEADESQLWLELLRDDCAIVGEQIDHLLRETDELMAIFTSMVSRVRKSGI